jgi:hypothetical protein
MTTPLKDNTLTEDIALGDRAAEALAYLHSEGFDGALVEPSGPSGGYTVALGYMEETASGLRPRRFWSGVTWAGDTTPSDPLDFAKLQVAAWRRNYLVAEAVEEEEAAGDDYSQVSAAYEGSEPSQTDIVYRSAEDAMPEQPEAEVLPRSGPEGGSVGANSPSYPGVAWEKLSDELSILRAQVIDMISAREEIRLDALVDPSRREDLRQSFVDYQNKGALGLEPSAQDRDLYVQYMDWQAKEGALRTHASALRRSARDANIAILRLMAANVDINWP